MLEYITVAEVDGVFGLTWAAPDKKERAVLMANVWLTSRSLPERDPIPTEWKQAGAEIAREAAAGKIYGTTETGVLSKSVKADTVSISKIFSTDHRVVSAGESLALALLKPWLGRGGVFMLKRV